MNMILHHRPTATIRPGNTLTNPKFLHGDTLRTFDFVVANPPFSDKRWTSGLHPDEIGVPAESEGVDQATRTACFSVETLRSAGSRPLEIAFESAGPFTPKVKPPRASGPGSGEPPFAF